MKIKISLVILTLFVCFFSYKFITYKKKCNTLNKEYIMHKMESSGFSFFFSKWFESKGRLPKEENVIKYIDGIGRNKSNYVIEIDSIINSVKVIKKGNVFNKNPFQNLIEINNNEDYLSDFSFLNYLIYGDFNLLIYNNKFKYNCDNNNSGTHIFVTNQNHFILSDNKLLNSLKNLLKVHNLELSRYEDKKVITILYNKGKIVLKCKDQERILSDGVLDTIKNLLENNFPSHPSIKFSLRY